MINDNHKKQGLAIHEKREREKEQQKLFECLEKEGFKIRFEVFEITETNRILKFV